MKRYLIAGVVLLALALGTLVVSSAQAGPKPVPVLGFNPAGPYDYGSVAIGRTAPQDFTLSLAGPKGTIGPFTTSISPTTAGFSIATDTCKGKRISVNKSCRITVSYSPTVVGSTTATLTASTNAGAYGASVSLSGTGFTNNAPTADPESVTTTPGTGVDITLSGSDPDGDSLTFETTGGPSHGWLTPNFPSTLCMVGGGCTMKVSYDPDDNYTGTDSFTYTVNDGLDSSAAATVTITVGTVQPGLSINSPPEAISNNQPNLTFTVTLSAASASNVTFNWAATDGATDYKDAAIWGTSCDTTADYTSAAQTGTGTITAGQTSTTIVFGTCNDGPMNVYPYLFDTYFTVTLSNPSGATITTGTGIGHIGMS